MVFAIIHKATRFTNDAAGVEKTLRFLQSISQIVAALTVADAAPYLIARRQFALGRRYLRFFKFIDCFNAAFNVFNIDKKSGEGLLAQVLDFGKWSFLGMYLLLESCTILDAMTITTTTWGPFLFQQAMKFWFYSLICSMASQILSLISLWSMPSVHVDHGEKEGTQQSTKDATPVATGHSAKEIQSKKIWRRMVIDVCDLCIPGSAVGWIRMGPAAVGTASAISTVLASSDIWKRVNNH